MKREIDELRTVIEEKDREFEDLRTENYTEARNSEKKRIFA